MTLHIKNISAAQISLGGLTPSWLGPNEEVDLDVANTRAEIANQGVVAEALDANPSVLQVITDTYPIDYTDPGNESACIFSGVSVSDVQDIHASPVDEIKMIDQGTNAVVTVTVVNGVLIVTP